jgi:MurNAc alpha-1-phosphate uridylyltransferase
MNWPVVILAGGLATRLHPLTFTTPKSLMMINGYPFIGWQLKLLASRGVKRVILCLGHKASDIIEFVGDGKQFDIEVKYSVEEQALGTGGALKLAEPILGDYFGVLYGDSYLPVNYPEIARGFDTSKKLGRMTIFKNQDEFEKSNVFLDSNGNFRYSKKLHNKDMNYVDYGFTLLSCKALLRIQEDSPFDLSDLFEELSLLSEVEFYEVHERFYEVGSFRGISDLEKFLKGEKSEFYG